MMTIRGKKTFFSFAVIGTVLFNSIFNFAYALDAETRSVDSAESTQTAQLEQAPTTPDTTAAQGARGEAADTTRTVTPDGTLAPQLQEEPTKSDTSGTTTQLPTTGTIVDTNISGGTQVNLPIETLPAGGTVTGGSTTVSPDVIVLGGSGGTHGSTVGGPGHGSTNGGGTPDPVSGSGDLSVVVNCNLNPHGTANTCGAITQCEIQVRNFSGTQAFTNVDLYINLSEGTFASGLINQLGATHGFSCQVVNNGAAIACSGGTVQPGQTAYVTVPVQLNVCACETQHLFEIHAGVQVNDINTLNNSDTKIYVFTGEACNGAVCTDPVQAVTITSHTSGQVVNNGAVIISGTVSSATSASGVFVTYGGGQPVYVPVISGTRQLPIILQSGVNSIEVVSVSADPDCREKVFAYTTIIFSSNQCPNPLTLTFGSHINGQTLTTQTVTITGTVSPADNVSGVFVIYGANMLSGTSVQATVIGNIWSAVITLQPVGETLIWVKALPKNPSLCPMAVIDYVVLRYTNPGVCTAPLDSLNIYQPSSGSVFSTNFVFLVGSALPGQNLQRVTVAANGGIAENATLFGSGSWAFAAYDRLQSGQNIIEVIGYSTDPDCPPYRTTVVVYYYPAATCEAPLGSITISSPINESVFTTQTVTVTGTIAGGAAATSGVFVSVNGAAQQAATLYPNGTWSAVITLQTGTNLVTATAIPVDAECSTVSTEVKYNYIPVPPQGCYAPLTGLDILSPASGIVISGSTVFVNGTVYPVQNVNYLRIRINGGTWVHLLPGTNGTRSAELGHVLSGANLIEVEAYSIDHPDCPILVDSTTVYQGVSGDQCTAPIVLVDIMSPATDTALSGNSLTVSGIVTPVSNVQKLEISVNGGVWLPVSIDTVPVGQLTGTWSVQLTGLITGGNSIVVRATSTDSNDCSVKYDRVSVVVGPVGYDQCTAGIERVKIVQPGNGSVVNTGTIPVQGMVAPVQHVQSLQISVNSGPWQDIAITGNWSTIVSGLLSGQNTITVKAISTDTLDCATMYHTIVITYVPGLGGGICPTPLLGIAILQPASGTVVNEQLINITGLVVPAGNVGQIVVRVNGGHWMRVGSWSGGVWNMLVSLTTGANVIEAMATPVGGVTDICGPVSTSTTVYYNSVPTGNQCTADIEWVKILQPASGSVVTTGTVTVNGMVFPTQNVQSLQISVNNGAWQNVAITGNRSATIGGLVSGANTISVRAISTDSPDCPTLYDRITIRYVPENGPQCEHPVSGITVLQPLSGSVLTSPFVTAEGFVVPAGNVGTVLVRVNSGSRMSATITTGGVWSRLVGLTTGANVIEAMAISVDGVSSVCEPVKTSTTVYYNPTTGGQCTAPLSDISFVSHVDNQQISGQTLMISGTVNPGSNVSQVLVNVNTGSVISASLSGNTWSAIIPVQSGANVISVRASSVDSDCNAVQVTRVLYNTTGGNNVCEYPLSGLIVTSHTNNQTITGNTAVLSGTVSGNVSVITVNGVAASLSGNIWTRSVNLQSGANVFAISGYSVDADCSPVTATVVLTSNTTNYCETLIGFEFLSGQTTTVNNSTSTYTIYGRVLTGTTVLFGTSSVAVNASGLFNVTVNLVNGTNTFTFIAMRDDLCQISKTITIIRNTNNGGSNGGGTNGNYGGGSNSCGDGIVRNSEQCDDGNSVNGDGCDNNCRFDSGYGYGFCGNDIIESGETCDDGNTRNGDGCSSICSRETDDDSDIVRRLRRIRPLPSTGGPLELPRELPKTGTNERALLAPSRVAAVAEQLMTD